MREQLLPLPAWILFGILTFCFIGSIPWVERKWRALGVRFGLAVADACDDRKYSRWP